MGPQVFVSMTYCVTLASGSRQYIYRWCLFIFQTLTESPHRVDRSRYVCLMRLAASSYVTAESFAPPGRGPFVDSRCVVVFCLCLTRRRLSMIFDALRHSGHRHRVYFLKSVGYPAFVNEAGYYSETKTKHDYAPGNHERSEIDNSIVCM